MSDIKSPWSSNNSSGSKPSSSPGSKKTPPNVEFLFNKGKKPLGNLPPIKSSNIIALGIIFLLAIWGVSGFYVVDAKQQGVVLRFGKYSHTTGPGLHYHLPYPIEQVFKPDVMQENRIEIGFRTIEGKKTPLNSSVNNLAENNKTIEIPEESSMLTGDENIVDIYFTVTWKIKNAADFLFNVNNPENTVRIAAESSMRDIVAQTPIQDIMTEKRNDVQIKVQENLQKLLDVLQAGVSITVVQMQDVNPPAPVSDAFYDVQRAKADRERVKNDAEAYRNNILPTARGDAARIVQDATAYKEQKINLATGTASRFLAMLAEFERNPSITSKKIYLDTMEGIMQQANKIIIDPKLTGLLPVLPIQKKEK